MTKSMLVLALALVSATAFADTFDCRILPKSYNDFGDSFTAVLGSRTIRLTNLQTEDIKSVSGQIDRTYRPRAQNKGSLRYNVAVDAPGGGTGCDHAQIYLNSAMASGGDGRLTIAFECDADGTGPLFESYACRLR
jgi:hypothetical protein